MPNQAKMGKDHRLLVALADELKLPLLQIARQAELSRANPDAKLLENIEIAAEQAIWFIDSYLLSQQLQQQSLELEPVTVSSVLHDAAQSLDGMAKQYNCELELKLSGRYGPVMAHRQALQTALIGLGSSLIAAGSSEKGKRTIILAAHKSHPGVVAGAFAETDGLSEALFQRGKALYGRARQPLSDLTATSGAGIFIADTLFTAMSSRLRVAHHHKLTGLAATLIPSQQLAWI